MPVTVMEKFESRQSSMGDSPQVELAYIVSGTDDDIAAKTSLLAATPIWYDGLIRQSLAIEPVGPGMWDGKVRYGRLEKQPPTGEHTFSFDTGGGTQHITQGIETIGRMRPMAIPRISAARSVSRTTASRAWTSRSRSTSSPRRITCRPPW